MAAAGSSGGMRLALGTVQLGLPYGAANTTGMPSEQQAVEMVHFAVRNGVTSLDTAHMYELSQERVGKALASLNQAGDTADDVADEGAEPRQKRAKTVALPHVVTKLDAAMEKCKDAAAAVKIVDESIANSKGTLKMDPLHTVCLHRWSVHGPSCHGGAAWNRLKHHKEQGNVERIGTSTYDPCEVLEALADPDCGHIQFPFNIIDHRWRESAVFEAIKNRPDVTVHTRSSFLQGCLVSGSERWPVKFGSKCADEFVAAIEALVSKLGRKNKVDLCLAYARGHTFVSEVLVGAETIEQLHELVDLAKLPALTEDEIATVNTSLPRAPADLLNPGKWQDKPTYAGSYGGPVKDSDPKAASSKTDRD